MPGNPLRSTSQVARDLGTNYWNIWTLIQRLEPPPLMVGNVWLWSPADVARVRALLRAKPSRGRPRKAVADA